MIRDRVFTFGFACVCTLGILGQGCGSQSASTGMGTGGAQIPGTGGASTGGAPSTGSGGVSNTGGAPMTGTGGSTTTGTGGNSTTGTGGTSTPGTGGAGGTIVVGGCGASPTAWTGSATRPQLMDASAACFTVKNYLAAAGTIGALTTDNWDPSAGLGDAAAFKPQFTVAADGSGTHATVQEAITAAKASVGTARVYILVKPGTYREPVCVDGNVPITLYGVDPDASKVAIAYDNYNSKPATAGKANPCKALAATATVFGTSDSTTFFVKASGFQAMNLTIANDTDEAAVGAAKVPPVAANGTFQGVAMTTQGDKLVFQNVRLIGNQDTLQPGSSADNVVARAYYKASFIEGDTDFIFGKGIAVFDNCTINYIGTRKNNGGHFAPSTDQGSAFGYLIIGSKITAGMGTLPGKTSLARSYSEKVTSNGQLVIRETQIDNHVMLAAPYKAATGTAITPPPEFDATKNRLFEYKNTGAGAAP